MKQRDPETVVVLFDIDGTLIDSSGSGGGALLAALTAEFGITDPTPVHLHGRTDLGIMSELLTSHGLDAGKSELEKLCTTYYRLLPDVLRARAGRVLPGVFKLLNALRDAQGCALGLLTGNMPTSAQLKLEHYSLWSYFDGGTYGDAAAERPLLAEPATQLAHKLAGSQIADENIVVVGDTPLDVELATAMGARCVAVCTGGYSAAELADVGQPWIVADLTATDDVVRWCLSNRSAPPN